MSSSEENVVQKQYVHHFVAFRWIDTEEQAASWKQQKGEDKQVQTAEGKKQFCKDVCEFPGFIPKVVASTAGMSFTSDRTDGIEGCVYVIIEKDELETYAKDPDHMEMRGRWKPKFCEDVAWDFDLPFTSPFPHDGCWYHVVSFKFLESMTEELKAEMYGELAKFPEELEIDGKSAVVSASGGKSFTTARTKGFEGCVLVVLKPPSELGMGSYEEMHKKFQESERLTRFAEKWRGHYEKTMAWDFVGNMSKIPRHDMKAEAAKSAQFCAKKNLGKFMKNDEECIANRSEMHVIVSSL